jgi:ribose 5-phosphate isomerase B
VRIAIGSDHAGYELKTHLAKGLADAGHQVLDLGTDSESSVDYPPFCAAVGRAVVRGDADRGIVLGGSGQGEQIAANKVHGVRAALAWTEDTAVLAREHNDANVISIGARMHTADEATRMVELFLTTAFSGDERHARRIAMIAAFENTGELPELPDVQAG